LRTDTPRISGILRSLAQSSRYTCAMAEDFASPERVLHVSQLRDPQNDDEWNKWITTRSLEVYADEWLRVPIDFPTDLTSVPNAFSWFIPRAGRFARAAVLHDHLWKLAEKDKTDVTKYDRRKADRQFRAALENSGVALLRRWIMWAAVRLASIFVKRDPGKGWWIDVPGIVALVLIALPIVGPPALVILPATVVFGALEKGVHYLTPGKDRQQRQVPKIQFWT
jgi:Protein of unknown function (DUF1353)